METIENAADNIFREIRRIEIYRSENLSYIDNFQKKKALRSCRSGNSKYHS